MRPEFFSVEPMVVLIDAVGAAVMGAKLRAKLRKPAPAQYKRDCARRVRCTQKPAACAACPPPVLYPRYFDAIEPSTGAAGAPLLPRPSMIRENRSTWPCVVSSQLNPSA
jgi:hypothetical protein